MLWTLIVGIATVVGLATAFADNLGAGLVAALVILAAGCLLLLVVSRTEVAQLRADRQEMRRSLDTLRKYVTARLPAQPRNLALSDQQFVGKNGDTFTRAYLKILVEGTTPLHFIESEQDGEPLSRREQRRLMPIARREPDGARLFVDVDWQSARTLRFWIHFERPIPPGEEVSFSYEYTWPHTLPNLTRGGVEHPGWDFVRRTDSFEFEVRLEAALGWSRPLKLTVEGMPGADVTPRAVTGTLGACEERPRTSRPATKSHSTLTPG